MCFGIFTAGEGTRTMKLGRCVAHYGVHYTRAVQKPAATQMKEIKSSYEECEYNLGVIYFNNVCNPTAFH